MEDFEKPISLSVAHIYLSALPFTPRKSQVSQYFAKLFPRTAVSSGAVTKALSSQHIRPVRMLLCYKEILYLQYSRDGQMIAAGLTDGTIRIFSTKAWEEIMSMKLPKEFYTLLTTTLAAFSVDGKRLTVITVEDRKYMVHTWGVLEGNKLSEHYIPVNLDSVYVALSPNSTLR